jgi:hypothetical protein
VLSTQYPCKKRKILEKREESPAVKAKKDKLIPPDGVQGETRIKLLPSQAKE